MAKITYIQDNNANGNETFIGLATMAVLLTMVITVLGIKFRWFKRQMSFQPVTTSDTNGVVGINGSYRSSVDLSNSISQGIFRMRNDEDNIIERPQSLPLSPKMKTIRVRKTSREPPPPLLPQKRTVTPKPPGQELIPETPLTEVGPPLFFPRVKKNHSRSPSIQPPETLFEDQREETPTEVPVEQVENHSRPSSIPLFEDQGEDTPTSTEVDQVQQEEYRLRTTQDHQVPETLFENQREDTPTSTELKQVQEEELPPIHRPRKKKKRPKDLPLHSNSFTNSSTDEVTPCNQRPKSFENVVETYEAISFSSDSVQGARIVKQITFEGVPDTDEEKNTFPEATKYNKSEIEESRPATPARKKIHFDIPPMEDPLTPDVDIERDIHIKIPNMSLDEIAWPTSFEELKAQIRIQTDTDSVYKSDESDSYVPKRRPTGPVFDFKENEDMSAGIQLLQFDSDEEFNVMKPTIHPSQADAVPRPVPRQRSIAKDYIPPLPKTPPPPSFPEMQTTSWSAIEIHRNLTKELNDELLAVTSRKNAIIDEQNNNKVVESLEPPPRNMRDMMKRNQRARTEMEDSSV